VVPICVCFCFVIVIFCGDLCYVSFGSFVGVLRVG
jgi:hypothetical protein